ncbi:MAG: shikimate kinase [Firmicutes bacterium]|jgi:shikimate kinase|nr:shikimate kinase [Bacillota bacterium]
MKNKNIVLIGMPGAGKTTIAGIIKEKFDLSYEVIDMDEEIEKRQGMTINEIFKQYGEEFFRKLESELSQELGKNDGKIISTGGGVILEYENIKALKENGVVLFIDRSLEEIIKDFDGDNRPLVLDNIKRLHELYEQRILLYRKYNDYSIPNNKSIDDFVFALNIILRKEGIL